MVKSGVKPLALSPPLPTEEMDLFIAEAEKIAGQYEIELFREADLIETDLFSDSLVVGKEVLILYKGNGLRSYQALKTEIEEAKSAGSYSGDQKIAFSRRFGRLLGYPVERINALLAENSDFRDLQDFGIKGLETHWFYKDLNAARDFYTKKLGLKIQSDSDSLVVLGIAGDAKLVLRDLSKSTYSSTTPKSVALAFLTEDLQGWYDHLLAKNVPIKYSLKVKPGGPHDGFVAVDPEGYLLEFETFFQHPENEILIPELSQLPAEPTALDVNLSLQGSITWLYYKDMLPAQLFVEENVGLTLSADQGWAKIYRLSTNSYLGLVDGLRGMNAFSDQKLVELKLDLARPEEWGTYLKTKSSDSTQVAGFFRDPGFYRYTY
ncbi:VOC family protein [Algoriphagus litoralis]|uniref:VOC family protein n=1 Tax=Algoriphagus litoralis TaxID=2202829 RepID=UPI0018E528CA|nr:VOC family protein [Algoriphagus litoralis]